MEMTLFIMHVLLTIQFAVLKAETGRRLEFNDSITIDELEPLGLQANYIVLAQGFGRGKQLKIKGSTEGDVDFYVKILNVQNELPFHLRMVISDNFITVTQGRFSEKDDDDLSIQYQTNKIGHSNTTVNLDIIRIDDDFFSILLEGEEIYQIAPFNASMCAAHLAVNGIGKHFKISYLATLTEDSSTVNSMSEKKKMECAVTANELGRSKDTSFMTKTVETESKDDIEIRLELNSTTTYAQLRPCEHQPNYKELAQGFERGKQLKIKGSLEGDVDFSIKMLNIQKQLVFYLRLVISYNFIVVIQVDVNDDDGDISILHQTHDIEHGQRIFNLGIVRDEDSLFSVFLGGLELYSVMPLNPNMSAAQVAICGTGENIEISYSGRVDDTKLVFERVSEKKKTEDTVIGNDLGNWNDTSVMTKMVKTSKAEFQPKFMTYTGLKEQAEKKLHRLFTAIIAMVRKINNLTNVNVN